MVSCAVEKEDGLFPSLSSRRGDRWKNNNNKKKNCHGNQLYLLEMFWRCWKVPVAQQMTSWWAFSTPAEWCDPCLCLGEPRGNLHPTCRVGRAWSVLYMVCPSSLATRTARWDVSTTFMWLRSSSVLSTNRTVWLEGVVWKSSGSPTQRRALLWDANARSLTSTCMLAGNAQCPTTVARKGLANTPNRKQGLFFQ